MMRCEGGSLSMRISGSGNKLRGFANAAIYIHDFGRL